LYYRLLCQLESHLYRQQRTQLTAVSRRTANQIHCYFNRDDVTIIPNGVDVSHFCPAKRDSLRETARHKLSCSGEDIVLLLVGNDLLNKGLPVLLQAMCICRNLPFRLCIVGSDAASDTEEAIDRLDLRERIIFIGETADILFFYAAADLYVAPSLEDSFNLPVLESMACGLPIVVSVNAGVSEYLHDGVDSILLRDPQDPVELARILMRFSDRDFAAQLAARAVATASSLSWVRHSDAVYSVLEIYSSSAREQG